MRRVLLVPISPERCQVSPGTIKFVNSFKERSLGEVDWNVKNCSSIKACEIVKAMIRANIVAELVHYVVHYPSVPEGFDVLPEFYSTDRRA